MNTFNMKQWLTENKVGPYSKTQINESHEGNDQWLDRFHDLLHGLKIDQWMKKQIMDIPSRDIVSMYDETTPENALKDLIKKMFHSAREGKQIYEDSKLPYEYEIDEQEFEVNGTQYLVNYVIYYDYYFDYENEQYIFDMEAKVKSLYKGVGDEYVETTNPMDIKIATEYVNTKDNLFKQEEYIDVPEPGPDPGDNMDDDSWMTEKKTDEQIGVGYAMITKPSDPKY